jgi:hypothetical protein
MATVGATPFCVTFKVKFWVAFWPTPLLAVNTRLYIPPMFAAGVPLKIPVAGSKLTPAGNVPLRLNVGVGKPVAVTVNVSAVPTTNVVVGKLVTAGA